MAHLFVYGQKTFQKGNLNKAKDYNYECTHHKGTSKF